MTCHAAKARRRCLLVEQLEERTLLASFQGLGTLPDGTRAYDAWGVSGDGSVVVGRLEGQGGFRWTNEDGLVRIEYLSGAYPTEAIGISGDGLTIVGDAVRSSNPTSYEAIRWTAQTGTLGLGDLPGGNYRSAARDASADGSVIVGEAAATGGRFAFRWTDGTMVPIVSGAAFGVSADGSVVVGTRYGITPREAFRWTEETGVTDLGTLAAGSDSGAFDLSADGSVVVGKSGNEAFRWTAEMGMVGLGDLAGGAFLSSASGVSADGSVIVGASESASGSEAFIWDASHGMRSLEAVLGNDLALGARSPVGLCSKPTRFLTTQRPSLAEVSTLRVRPRRGWHAWMVK